MSLRQVLPDSLMLNWFDTVVRCKGKVTEASPSLHPVSGACHQHSNLHRLVEEMLVSFLHVE